MDRSAAQEAGAQGGGAGAVELSRLPDDITHRVYFARSRGSGGNAPLLSRPCARASSGEIRAWPRPALIGVRQDQVRLFERIVEAIGDLAMAD